MRNSVVAASPDRRRLVRRLSATLAGAALVGASLVAAFPASAASNQELLWGLDSDVPNLQTPMNQGSASMVLNAALHRGLVQYGASGKIVPALAQKFTSKGDQTFVFTMRPKIFFHTGAPVTTADVKATLEWAMDATHAPKLYPATKGIASITTTKTTATIKLVKPDASFLAFLADVSGAILPANRLGKTDPTYVGAGPFQFVSYEKGREFVVKKFAKFYDAKKVKLTGIKFEIIPDQAARDNAMFTGAVDIVSFAGWNNYNRYRQRSDLKLDETDGPFMYLVFNATTGPFADPKVRQAVAWAVNRDSVVNAALNGQGKGMYGMPIPKASAFFNLKQANYYYQSVSKAKALLAEAGYPNGFKATMLSSSQYSFHQNTAISVQADLKAIGIDLTLNLPDWSTRVALGAKGDYDIAVYGTVGVVNDPAFLEQILTPAGAQNASFGYNNAALNALLDQAKAEPNIAARKSLYAQIGDIVLNDAPIVTLASRSQAYAYSTNVKGFNNIPGFLTFESGYNLATTYKK